MNTRRLAPERTAVLLMDYQPDLLAFIPDPDAVLAGAERLRAAARAAGLPVFYVVVRFRDGYPEVSERNKSFFALKDVNILRERDASSFVHPALTPAADELVVTKRRVSAFWGTELSVALAARSVDTLILAGINTSGVILSTTRAAADMDFALTIVTDAVADPDPDLHAVLLDKVLATQADLLTAAELAQELGV